MKINQDNNFISFVKRNWMCLTAILMVVVIGTTVGLVVGNQPQQSANVFVDDEDNNDNTPFVPDNNEDDDIKDGDKEDDKEDNDVPVSAKPISFALPMSNPVIVKDYSSTTLQYNATLDRWEAHLSVDFTSNNLDVFSVLDGEILSIDYDYLNGNVVKIKHSDGFISEYGSLENGVSVNVGDKVLKGEIVGRASASAGNSSSYGNHLEFTLYKDNQKIDPNNYLDSQLK